MSSANIWAVHPTSLLKFYNRHWLPAVTFSVRVEVTVLKPGYTLNFALHFCLNQISRPAYSSWCDQHIRCWWTALSVATLWRRAVVTLNCSSYCRCPLCFWQYISYKAAGWYCRHGIWRVSNILVFICIIAFLSLSLQSASNFRKPWAYFTAKKDND